MHAGTDMPAALRAESSAEDSMPQKLYSLQQIFLNFNFSVPKGKERPSAPRFLPLQG